MPNQSIDIGKITAEYKAFRSGFQTLVLGTLEEDLPQVSYSPFVEHDGALYIYVSELAAHTRQVLSAGRCAVLLVEDEQASRNLFARRRISYQCRANEVSQQSETGQQVLAGMRARFGNIMEVLMTLQDFHLIRLEIEKGAYVAGFGKAFTVYADGTLEQVARM